MLSSTRRAKIVCTMGPASLAPGVAERLIHVGMDCARLNMSHGDHATHLETARRVRRAAQDAGRTVSILADLQGPKLRVGSFPGGSIELVSGAHFVLSGRGDTNDELRATVSYPRLALELRRGDPVLLDDGLLALRVQEIVGDDVICTVEIGGVLSDHKGVNLPGADLSVPSLTDKDRLDLEFALSELEADFIALSFVRRPEDIAHAKNLAGATPVIAKIEKPEALARLEEILEVADGAMVARGDLGVEMGSEKVPMAQKRIIREANRRGKLVITATQMLDSMIRNPRPTRAEAADVANAVLDGTDAVMLSGETATGRYPVESVQMMDAIIREAEGSLSVSRGVREQRLEGEWELSDAAARGAAILSMTLPLVGVVVITSDGRSAELLSEQRPLAPIFALTCDERVAGRLAARWGVCPVYEPMASSLDEAILLAGRVLREAGEAMGAPFALVLGWPLGGRSNLVLLERVR